MALKIRLTRKGDKKSPFYRLVVAESSSPRDGKFVDIVGTYDPKTNPATIKVDAEKTKKWIGFGATPTDTAKDILFKAGVIEDKKSKSKKN